MWRRPTTIPGPARLVAALAMIACASCGRDAGPSAGIRPTDAAAARRAVEAALAEWRDEAPGDLTTPTIRPLMFVDQQRRPGRRLRAFAVLDDSEMDGCRRFRVRLSMADPDETALAAYYVFGHDPIWVYRAEDFDMIMHMDKSMMPATGTNGGGAEAEVRGSAPPGRAG